MCCARNFFSMGFCHFLTTGADLRQDTLEKGKKTEKSTKIYKPLKIRAKNSKKNGDKSPKMRNLLVQGAFGGVPSAPAGCPNGPRAQTLRKSYKNLQACQKSRSIANRCAELSKIENICQRAQEAKFITSHHFENFDKKLEFLPYPRPNTSSQPPEHFIAGARLVLQGLRWGLDTKNPSPDSKNPSPESGQ